MPDPRAIRDPTLLDAIEALSAEPFSGTAWRVVREGRDPLQCSAVGGRWDDRTFEVLYTSTTAAGAVAEIYFHLGRGQPFMPSQVRYRLFELLVTLPACIQLPSLGHLEQLGLRTATFGQLSYAEREQEYPRSQEIAEAAFFLGHAGLKVPSARTDALNLIIFCERVMPESWEIAKDHGVVHWESWPTLQSRS